MGDGVNPADLIDFPCHYTFKAVGIGGAEFPTSITAAVSSYAMVHRDAVHIRPSAKGNYQSVSVIVRLDSFQQLTDIYAEMKKVSGLKMLL